MPARLKVDAEWLHRLRPLRAGLDDFRARRYNLSRDLPRRFIRRLSRGSRTRAVLAVRGRLVQPHTGPGRVSCMLGGELLELVRLGVLAVSARQRERRRQRHGVHTLRAGVLPGRGRAADVRCLSVGDVCRGSRGGGVLAMCTRMDDARGYRAGCVRAVSGGDRGAGR